MNFNFILVSLFACTITTTAWAEPPKPAQMSREEVGNILKNLPGEMCEIKNLQLIFKDSINSIYNVFLGNPSGQMCELTFKIWREQVTTLPDVKPAPADYYQMRNTIINGDPKACPCL